jgi:hypothetical protein
MKARTLLCCLVSRLALPLLVYSQGVGASGDIRGTIRDTSAAIMQNVAVAVVDAGRGVRRTATTDTAGQFRVPSLPPAIYDVSVAMPGFETQIQRNVVLNLGETLVVDFRMCPAGQEIVEVTSEPPVVDTAKGSQAGVVEQRLIQGWPINQRGILTFTLITPFASNSNTIADNADFRVKQTPQSGVADITSE